MDSDKLRKVIDNESRKESIVAFLDILGFKELVRHYVTSKNPHDDIEIINNITFALNDALKNVREGENEYLKLIDYKLFSDCVCLRIPSLHGTDKEASMLCTLITTIVRYNFELLRKDIYPRGGISFGFHYQDDNIIFSDGLVKAHYLEKEEAVYPRTIIDPELSQRLEKCWKDDKKKIIEFGTEKRILIDEKNVVFVNPFNLIQSVEKGNIFYNLLTNGYLKRTDDDYSKEILSNVEKKIQEYSSNNKVLKKYLWLKELINWNIDPKSSDKFRYFLE